ncbi:MAG: peptide deformylase [Spirochaetales bacterium]
MTILTLGNEVLRQEAKDVTNINGETKRLIQELFETMQVGRGIGLAGPQVGVLQRIFVVQLAEDIPRVFINPVIKGVSVESSQYEEGCLSIPGIYADVERPEKVSIEAWDERGKPFRLDAEGLLARVIQHEMDHLKGILFIDHLSELKRKRILRIWEQKFKA